MFAENELLEKLKDLQVEYSELSLQYTYAVYEELGYSDHTVSNYMRDALQMVARKIKDTEKQIEAVSICQEFANRVGQKLHDLYKEKYPITAKTKVVNVGSFGYSTYYYALPTKHQIFSPQDTVSISPTVMIEQGRASVELWGLDEDWVFKVAYAPEINTIFLAKT